MLKRILAAAAAVALLAGTASAGPFGLPSVGLGVHGGWVTSYKNQTVEQGIQNAYNSVTNFKLSGSMHDIGGNIDMSSGIFGVDVSLDYAWKTQRVISGVDVKYNSLALTGAAIVAVPFVISPYAGVGVGAFRTAQSLSTANVVVVLPSNKTNFGWLVKAGVGANIPLFPLYPFFEWRYERVNTPNHPTTYDSLLLGVNIKL